MTEPTTRLARPGVGDDGRDEILEAAALEFMERGYAAASIDGIADRLGATKGRVYHYYRSKADLYLDVQRKATEVALAVVEPLAVASGSHVERLRAMAIAHITVVLQHFPLQRVSAQGLERALSTAGRDGGLEHVIDLRDRYEQLFVRAIDAGVRDGDLRRVDPRLAVKPFLGALNWTVFWYRPAETRNDRDDAALAAELAEFVVRGLLA
ncbi:MAG TPA: TetR/AcrR family transcriptional regulator [Ilumatobacter sp.]|nr:TetR/AcrR family transcriptional regulator [Ilumatobacter sp.]